MASKNIIVIKFWVYDVPNLLKLNLNKFSEMLFVKIQTKNATIQKFSFKRSPKLVYYRILSSNRPLSRARPGATLVPKSLKGT